MGNERLRYVWRIVSSNQALTYAVARERVRHEMAITVQDAESYLKDTGYSDYSSSFKAKLDGLAKKLVYQEDSDINERILLHGTSPITVPLILKSGMNERFSDGLFGKGTYLAEDFKKSHAYTDVVGEMNGAAISEQFVDHLY